MHPYAYPTVEPPPAQPLRLPDQPKCTRRRRARWTRLAGGIAALALLGALLGACGSGAPGEKDTPTATIEPPTATPSATPTATPSGPLPVRSMDQVPQAVIRIEVEGRFRPIGEAQIEGRA